jgi:hypothetical protein
MCEINKEDETQKNKERGPNEGNVIAPEHVKAVGNEPGSDNENDPQQNLGTPISILDSRPFIPRILDSNQRDAQYCMEQCQSETNPMDGQYPITLVSVTIHFDIIVAPFFYEMDCPARPHQPCEHRIQTEYQGESNTGGNGRIAVT